jgi:hypothetical protein
MAQELKTREHLLQAVQKKHSDNKQEDKVHAELSILYSNFIKLMAQYKVKTTMLTMTMPEI